ncbi:MAG: CRISPR-associated protein Cas4 [Candidatus Hadarchaeales archaeon]
MSWRGMKGFGSAGEISAWEVYQYFYCPRKLYFIRKLGLYPPERKKVELGGEQHGREPGRTGRRKRIYGFSPEEVDRILHDLPLEDREMGLFGKADTVVRLKSGEMVPVDVKYSDLPYVSRAWRKQMLAYAVLLERSLGVRIRRGLIYLLPSHRTFWLNILPEEKEALKRDLEKIREMIASDQVPRAASPEYCGYCEVAKFCKRV